MNCQIAIIGGGLAGLSLAIDLKKRGYSVLVIEKGNYPRHKVCGEYISMESHRYLHTLCPALSKLDLPFINQFKLSSIGDKEFETQLDLGGFGISRYLLEELLFKEAQMQDVQFLLDAKAQQLTKDGQDYLINTNSGAIRAQLVCNATGRQSNLSSENVLRIASHVNYVGVKYHIKLPRKANFIEIHNFPGGYCGISNIEADLVCLCYIVNSKYLKSSHNSIAEMEKNYLYQNKNLEQIFTTAEFVFREPVTVSGIHFLIKKPATDEALYLGDAAGSVAPIVGNGMSMALRAASVLAHQIDQYLSKKITKSQLLENYKNFWNKEFSYRIKQSRYLQKLSEFSFLTKGIINLFKFFPPLAKFVIRQTHGQPF